MPTIFTRIIEGELPGVFVWRDPQCVAFLSINPMHPGHTLVVPRAEVDHWIDLDPELAAHLFQVAQTIGQAQEAALVGPPHRRDDRGRRGAARAPPRRAVRLGVASCRSRNADPNPPEGSLEAAAAKIRAALRDTRCSWRGARQRVVRWAGTTSGSRRDAAVVWHGFTQMSTYADNAPVIVERAEGHELIDVDGRRYLDAISSLWVNTLGHHVPELDDALRDQLDRGAHSTMLGNGNRVVVELAEALARGRARRRPALPLRVRRRRRGRAGAEDRVPVLGQPAASPAARTLPRVRRRVPRRHHRRALGRRRRLRHRPVRPAALPGAARARLRRPRLLRHRDARWSPRTPPSWRR